MTRKKLLYGAAALIVIVVGFTWYKGYTAKKKLDALKNEELK